MIVESKAGGIDIYAAGSGIFKAERRTDSKWYGAHIEGGSGDKNDQRTWGYVEYHGMNGYVPLDDCRPAQSRQELSTQSCILPERIMLIMMRTTM